MMRPMKNDVCVRVSRIMRSKRIEKRNILRLLVTMQNSKV